MIIKWWQRVIILTHLSYITINTRITTIIESIHLYIITLASTIIIVALTRTNRWTIYLVSNNTITIYTAINNSQDIINTNNYHHHLIITITILDILQTVIVIIS